MIIVPLHKIIIFIIKLEKVKIQLFQCKNLAIVMRIKLWIPKIKSLNKLVLIKK